MIAVSVEQYSVRAFRTPAIIVDRRALSGSMRYINDARNFFGEKDTNLVRGPHP